MDEKVVQLTEWESGRRAPVDELSDTDRELADALRTADGGRIIVEERRDGVWVSAQSWVGVVRFSEFEVRVVPKLAGGNLGVVRMLDYASGVGALRRQAAQRQLETKGASLLELVAWLFADACAQIARDGLLSDYVTKEDSLHVLRGRLRTLEQATRRFARVDPLEVSFDEFDTDIPENQIISAALATTRSVVRTPIVQRPIRRMHAVWLDACNIEGLDASALLDDVAYNRRTEHYRYAHLLAGLLLRRLAVRDLFTPGGTRSFAFLIDMNDLFESFVSRLVAEALKPLGIRVHAQRRDRTIVIDDSTGKGYSAIVPDLLLEARHGESIVRLPVDAKYKLYDNKKLHEPDVYQAFFYAFAYASESQARHLARAVILYPRAGEGTDTALRVETHTGLQNARIQAFGVDVESALDAVENGRASVASLPAVARLLQVYRDVARAAREERTWLASSA
jgi:5-methylcytosine-specific restriction enzyme subunit McrC